MTQDALPSFDRPPVIETVLGVQFDPIPKLTNAHLGAFWMTLGDEWPHVADAPKLDRVEERFGAEQAWGALIGLKLTQDPSSRVQIRNKDEDRMIQVQNGRLHYNWLGLHGGPYPRYKNVRPAFDKIWDQFKQFLESRSLDAPKPNQWEVTYVNSMPKGTVWKDPLDWGKLLPGLGGPAISPNGVALESFGGEWHFEIPPQRGRLHVKVHPGKQGGPDGDEILRMDLTARGPVSENGGGASLDAGLELGHRTIVNAFVDLTSRDAHDYWRLQNA